MTVPTRPTRPSSPTSHTGHTGPPTTDAPTARPGPASVTARAVITTAAGPGGATRLETLRSDPPLTLRQTGPGLVHLVSTAAGPLGGDRLELRIEVAPGTSLEVRSVASTLVLPGSSPGDSWMVIDAQVGAGASLRFSPEPTVLAAGCSHRMAVRLWLEEDASAFWREEIVFGRHGERPGRCRARFDVTVAGRPLLRQELVVGDPSTDRSPAVYGDARCVGSTLVAGPAWTSPAVPDGKAERRATVGDGWAALPLAGPGVLASALASDTVELRARLERAESLAALHPSPAPQRAETPAALHPSPAP
ncbi:urease accessory protein UreD [Planotetraspora sp. A-T 1434]|uniref:urease accessory protein UreD n=1 Tax=Planotetraspora sp. A-T 1434 TaxID=2979219 RepID=UPI0021BF8499|nr:urease accessory protein UreD [Planotetraspora sp. A-T 1434]MCT9932989.1 urease accessory protein UreD [Planotetraspora sp. A-T 1434]